MSGTSTIKSIFDLIRAFPDEQSCIDRLELIRWGGNVTSPFSPGGKVYKLPNNRYKCRQSNKYFNVRTQTILEGTKIPLRQWFMAIYLFTSHKKGISSYQLARDLNITQKTSWFMLHRIRYAMEHQEFLKELSGAIQVDETFVGGKNKNRHHDKKVEQSQGRSFKDKTPVLGILQTAEKETIERPHKLIPGKTVRETKTTKQAVIQCKVVKNTQKETIVPHLKEKVQQGSILMSDEWKAYTGLDNYFCHQIVDHSRKQYVNESGATTNAIENFWSHFKRGWSSTYSGKITPKHLQKYTDEFSFRYCTKDHTTENRFNTLLQGTNGKRITYRTLTQK